MALNFPDSPVDGQEYTNSVTGVIYTYKLTKDQWTGPLECDIEPLTLETPIIDNVSPEVGDLLTATASAAGGDVPYTYTYQWKRDDTNIGGATSVGYTVVEADIGDTLKVEVTVTDSTSTPNTATATSNPTAVVPVNTVAPVISSVSLVENAPDGDRFTSQGFTTSATMTTEGIPAPDFALKGYAEGTLARKAVTDVINNVSDQTTGAWTSASSIDNNATWRSITYGGGKFVAFGRSTSFPMYSTDGINWSVCNSTSSMQKDWEDVTYGGDKFVVVDTHGYFMYSYDGITWQPIPSQPSASSYNWHGIGYGNGQFVAVQQSNSNVTLNSTDGLSWTLNYGIPSATWYNIAYGNGKWVAVRGNGSYPVATSTDGINYNQISDNSLSNLALLNIAFGNGLFVISLYNSTKSAYSADGENWTVVDAMSEANKWYGITYGDGKFVCVAGNGTNQVMWSTDAVNWNLTSAPENNEWQSVAYGGGKFVAVSDDGTNKVMYSTTGSGAITLKSLTFATDQDLSAFTAGDNVVSDPAGATGTITSLDVGSKQMVLNPYSGSWTANTGMKVTGNVTVEISKLYTVMNTAGQITDLVEDDPGFSTQASGTSPWGITFPAVLPSGETPDVALPDGTSFTVDLKATNTIGTSTKTSNAVVPVGPPSIAGCFASTLYTGTGALQSITTGVNTYNINDGLIWIKSLNITADQSLTDTVRGPNLVLHSNSSADQVYNNDEGVDTFQTAGFGIKGTTAANNQLGEEYISWSFKSTPKFFDVVTYDGNSTSGHAINHSLTTAPGFMIVKGTSYASNWQCYHTTLGRNSVIKLDSTDKADMGGKPNWASTTPTDTQFFVGPDSYGVNDSGQSYVAYLFAEDVADFIKCNYYMSTGAESLKITTGFPVGWVLIKDTTGNNGNYPWNIYDKTRGVGKVLCPNNAAAEQDWPTSLISFDSDGFTVGSTGDVNDPVGNTYIYVAIAAPDDGVFYTEDTTELANYNALKALFDGYPTRKASRQAAYAAVITAATAHITSSELETVQQFTE